MTPLRLFAIAFIVGCSTVAWFILGATIYDRTGESDGALREEVTRLWGGAHDQPAPTAWYEQSRLTTVVQQVAPFERTETIVDRFPVPLDSSNIDVALKLDQRQKGLLWYDTYGVRFSARYTLSNSTAEPRSVFVHFAFPAREAIYDGFRFRVNGADAPAATDLSEGVTATVQLAPAEVATVEVAYASRGLDRWHYSLGTGVSQVRDFVLRMKTDFRAIDFPAGTMSPTGRAPMAHGFTLTWRFERLVTGAKVGLDLPARQNPGPLAARISFFAPVSLLFFVTVMVILGVLRGQSLHPMNYTFLSAGFFAFHLLLAYLVDHLDLHVSFAIAAGVSVLLVVVYLALVGGLRLALLEAGIAQVVFLVLFSYAFFFEGYTGLTVTVGAILTLFVLMVMTARLDWGKVLARKTPVEAHQGEGATSGSSSG